MANCELKELVVDRAKWGKGNMLRKQQRPAFLKLSGDKETDYQPGKMCILGFVALACGNTAEDIEGCTFPPPYMNMPGWISAGKMFDVATINDSSSENRESLLTTVFAEHDCKLSFTGEP